MIATALGRHGGLGVAVVGLAVLLPASAVMARQDGPSRAPSGRPVTHIAERIHEVRAGDTLSGLARRYGVSVAVLVEANRLPSAGAKIKIGQRLTIPLPRVAVNRAARALARPRALRPPPNLVLTVPDFSDLVPIFTWPVEGRISSTYGWRRHGWHRGIDIKADFGAPITTTAPGVVIASRYEPRYGRVVKIEHAHGFVSVYAHNDENLVEIGDRVLLGQRIATIGRTGRATAHHLHFEIRHAGLVYNPLYLLPLPPRVLVEETDDEDANHDDG